MRQKRSCGLRARSRLSACPRMLRGCGCARRSGAAARGVRAASGREHPKHGERGKTEQNNQRGETGKRTAAASQIALPAAPARPFLAPCPALPCLAPGPRSGAGREPYLGPPLSPPRSAPRPLLGERGRPAFIR